MMLRTEIRHLLKLAWPLLIAQVTQTMMGVSDTIMAGRVSAADMAAVAIASSIVMPVLFFIQGIILALPPIVSRLHGAEDVKGIVQKGQQTLWLGLLLSLPFTLCYLAVPQLQGVLQMEPKLEAITLEYMQYLLIGAPAFALYQVFRQYCEGLSLTRPSMIIMGIGLLVNIPANYVFIYGKLGMPALGGAGCGIATSLVFTAMMISTLLYIQYAKSMRPYRLFGRWYHPKRREMGDILRLGVPIALTILFEVSLFAVVALLLAPYGSQVVASHQVALNFSSLMFMVPLSIGLACSIRVGQLLGQGRPQHAKTAVHGAWLVGLLCAAITAVFSLLMRYQIAGLYSHEDEVVRMAADLMFLAAVFQLSDAIQVISGCALRGYKDAKAMFYISFISYWGVGLSTGCILGLTDWIVPKMAATGFWIGFIVGLTCAAGLLGWRLTYIQRITAQPSAASA